MCLFPNHNFKKDSIFFLEDLFEWKNTLSTNKRPFRVLERPKMFV